MELNYFTATDFGFEVYGECSTYENALKCAPKIMKENNSNSVFIYNRRSGNTPYKIMVIPDSGFIDELYNKIDINHIRDCDFIQFILTDFESFIDIAIKNITVGHLINVNCRIIYSKLLHLKEFNLLHFVMDLNTECLELVKELLLRRCNPEKKCFIDAVKKLLERKWLNDRESLRLQMQSPRLTEDEAFKLLKKFEENRKNVPKVIIPNE